MKNKPPYQITPQVLHLLTEITHRLGHLQAVTGELFPLKLRRDNNIRTIQASLAIEGNTLGVEQITQLMQGKRVLGPAKDVLEVTNALNVYARLKEIDPLSEDDLLKTHGQLMAGLVGDAGKWRAGGVGVWQGRELKHMAPPAKRVPDLMASLFSYTAREPNLPWLLKACIFHYEFEFIHPFSDGNGRMGRLWQQLLLMRQDPIFEFMPVEVLVKEHQAEYYRVLGECDAQGESTLFIEFSLQQILDALNQFATGRTSRHADVATRLEISRQKFPGQYFSRKEYMSLFSDLSSATASRDLAHGLAEGLLESAGSHNQVRYRFME